MVKLYKIMFFIFMVMGTLIAVSANTWVGMWIGLEINLLSIIPLMNNSKNLFSSEASLKYFITQALASAILLFSILMIMSMENFTSSFSIMKPNNYLMVMNSSLLTKMGTAPFHFWFPEVIEGLNWSNSAILLTWQKIAPMALLMYNISMVEFLSIVIFFSMVVSGIIGLNQISLRKILAYSSINHMGWMIAATMMIETIWTYYFVIYTLISLNIILMFKYLNIFYLKQLLSSFNFNPTLKMGFIFNFLSLGGLPPFLGFLPKWMTIQAMIENQMYLLTFMMIVMTLMTLFYYLRISFSSLLLSSSELNFYINNKSTKNITVIMINLFTLLSLIFCTQVFNWL